MSGFADLPESHRDLLEAPLTAVLTTLDAKGRPQSTAVWYLLRNDELIVSFTDSRQKYRNVTADQRVGLFLLDPQNPMRTLEIRADAVLAHDPAKADVEAIATAYGANAEAIKSMPGERYTITLVPHRIVANPAA